MVELGPSHNDVPPEVRGGHISLEEAFELLWPGGKTIIACGHTFVGKEGYQVKVANILKMEDDQETLVGWAYQHRLGSYDPDKYEHEGFHRINGKTASHARLPDTFFVWISEIDDSMVLEENEPRAREIMDWALSLDNSPRPNLLQK